MAQSDPRGTHAAIQNIMKWARRPEWAALYEQVLQEHVGDVLEGHGLDSVDALAEKIGVAAVQSSIFGPVFEDFLTRDNDDGESIVDEYLRRRGYKETVPGRRYLEALGDSLMSLYEVIESVPGGHVVLRDLMRGGEPVRAEERSGSRQLVRWDIVATRVVPHNRQQMLSGVMLKVEPLRAQALLGALSEVAQEMQRNLGQRLAETVTRPAADGSASETEDAAFAHALQSIIREQSGTDDPDALRRFIDGRLAGVMRNLALHRAAPLFTRVWLEQTLGRLLGPPPELRRLLDLARTRPAGERRLTGANVAGRHGATRREGDDSCFAPMIASTSPHRPASATMAARRSRSRGAPAASSTTAGSARIAPPGAIPAGR